MKEYICTGRQESRESLDLFLAKHPEFREPDAMACVDDEKVLNGGKGSGFFGHYGRPGEVGGSAPAPTVQSDIENLEERSQMVREAFEHCLYDIKDPSLDESQSLEDAVSECIEDEFSADEYIGEGGSYKTEIEDLRQDLFARWNEYSRQVEQTKLDELEEYGYIGDVDLDDSSVEFQMAVRDKLFDELDEEVGRLENDNFRFTLLSEKGSKISESMYFTIRKASKLDDDEINIKVRVSQHDLPNIYDSPDVDVRLQTYVKDTIREVIDGLDDGGYLDEDNL